MLLAGCSLLNAEVTGEYLAWGSTLEPVAFGLLCSLTLLLQCGWCKICDHQRRACGRAGVLPETVSGDLEAAVVL